ncbi:hypothetical protein SAMN04487820_105230 [Actinopolyspora mzabensis]|uniref:Uncharacterized protein n=1 Tax=Actinopolyspora mzabensis TaxID=995066 RepID=A0A1G8ZZQ7_ACTMZ|nr:hypothetical protein SAMN04487820_105230 [Actinopolyspora mzabensis]
MIPTSARCCPAISSAKNRTGLCRAAMEPALLKQFGEPAPERMGLAMDTLLEKLFDGITS